MKLHRGKAFWLVSGLLLVIVVSSGLELAVAQPKGETKGPASDAREATFQLLGERTLVNTNHIAYTSDEGPVFDIYFACSSARGRGSAKVERYKRYNKGEIIF